MHNQNKIASIAGMKRFVTEGELEAKIKKHYLAGLRKPANEQISFAGRKGRISYFRLVRDSLTCLKSAREKAPETPLSILIRSLLDSQKHSILPREWLLLEIYQQADKRKRPGTVIPAGILIPCLRSTSSLKEGVRLSDKQQFHKLCKETEIATPLIAGKATPAGLAWYVDDEERQRNLFVKPANGMCGLDAMKLPYLGDGKYQWSSTRKDYPIVELEAKLIAKSKHLNDELLIQPCLVNHPALASIVGDTLATIRILTARVSGSPTLILAAIRCPPEGSDVDNFHQGGMAAPVDCKTGKISGPACYRDGKSQVSWRKKHPVSDIPFTDIQIPFWPELITTVLKMHEHCRDWLPSAGWDACVTSDGVFVVEGNEGWCGDICQIPSRTGLLETPFREHIREEW